MLSSRRARRALPTSKVKIDGRHTPNLAVTQTITSGFTTKFQAGQVWTARGGWRVEILHVTNDGQSLTALHRRPKDATSGWFGPQADTICNHEAWEGRVRTSLSVGEGPAWYGHPADLIKKTALKKGVASAK